MEFGQRNSCRRMSTKLDSESQLLNTSELLGAGQGAYEMWCRNDCVYVVLVLNCPTKTAELPDFSLETVGSEGRGSTEKFNKKKKFMLYTVVVDMLAANNE